MATKKTVNNTSSKQNPVGQFMVAVGAIIVNSEGKILLIKRSDDLDWQPGEWEIMYGRLAQHEDAQLGLVREASEELGIKVQASRPLTCWHIYRGQERITQNELIGITFLAYTVQAKVTLSDEHQEYRWVTPVEALELVKIEGIKRDINACMKEIGNFPNIKLGKYRHYKGKYYQVIGIGKHSETLEDYVYYKCLHENNTSPTWVRPLKMFQEKVKLPNGSLVSRFEYVDDKT